jgi:flagellar hook-basal body complex protein FliE
MINIEEYIKKQIEDIDLHDVVRELIRQLISDDVKRQIRDTSMEEVKRIVKTEVEIVLSKGVQTDDGWGKKESYTSFEEMFKKHFKEAINNHYEVRRTIEDYTKQQVKKLVDDKTKDIVEALKKALIP